MRTCVEGDAQLERSRTVTLIVGPIIEDVVNRVFSAAGPPQPEAASESSASSTTSTGSPGSSPEQTQLRPVARSRKRANSTEGADAAVLIDIPAAPLGSLSTGQAGAAHGSTGMALGVVAPWVLGNAMWSDSHQSRDLGWSHFLPAAVVPTAPISDWRVVGAQTSSLSEQEVLAHAGQRLRRPTTTRGAGSVIHSRT